MGHPANKMSTLNYFNYFFRRVFKSGLTYVYTSTHWAGAVIQPEQVKHIHTQSNTYRQFYCKFPILRSCMSLDCGSKPGHLEKAHTYMGLTCRNHTGRLQPTHCIHFVFAYRNQSNKKNCLEM